MLVTNFYNCNNKGYLLKWATLLTFNCEVMYLTRVPTFLIHNTTTLSPNFREYCSFDSTILI